jgi:hypothetical protein
LLQYYHLFHHLSLDVVMGVAIQLIAISIVLKIPLTVAYSVGLPLATWIIYLTDHILDIHKNTHTRLSERHEFIRKHYNLILGLLLLLISISTYLLLASQSQHLLFGALSIAILCLAYLGLTFIAPSQWQWLYNKELLVAFVYSASLWIYPAMLLGIVPKIAWGFIIVLITAYINLLMLSIMEQKDDVKQNRFSWVIILGRQRAVLLFNLLVITSVALASYAIVKVWEHEFTWFIITYIFVIFVHYALFKQINNKPHRVIRLVSEVLFGLPFWIILRALL